MSPGWIAILISVGVLALQLVAGIIFNRITQRRDEQERLDYLESGYYKYEEPDYKGTAAAVEREAEELNRLLAKGLLPEPTPPPGPGKIERGGA